MFINKPVIEYWIQMSIERTSDLEYSLYIENVYWLTINDEWIWVYSDFTSVASNCSMLGWHLKISCDLISNRVGHIISSSRNTVSIHHLLVAVLRVALWGGGGGKYINVQSFDNFQTSPLGYFNSSNSQVTLLCWWYMGRSNNTILRKLLALDMATILWLYSVKTCAARLVGVSKKFMWYWNLIGPLIYFQGNSYKKYQNCSAVAYYFRK